MRQTDLAGVTIVVTRAAHQAEELAAPLRALGATVILLPLVAIAPPLDPARLREAALGANQYDWIVFTSANAVEAFASNLNSAADVRARIAAIGSATRVAAENRDFRVTLMPQRYVAESLIEAFASEELTGRRVLIPRAAIARDVVPDALRNRGAHVDIVEAYRNIIPPEAALAAADTFREPFPEWVLFASSSAVDHFLTLCSPQTLARVSIATIGPITSATVREYGLTVRAEARPHTVRGLVETVAAAHMGSWQAER
jgi:uroporphyrinogen III methyltransferase/synthase